jgi:drug/metabolite transporter superfamily protein YnfA
VTALTEILGCYGVFLWLRHGKPVWWAVVAVVSLGIFAWLLTLHPFANAGRVYAAYGGVYIAASLLWLWLIEKQSARQVGFTRRGDLLDRGGNHLFWAERKRCTLKLPLSDKPPHHDCQVSPHKDSAWFQPVFLLPLARRISRASKVSGEQPFRKSGR